MLRKVCIWSCFEIRKYDRITIQKRGNISFERAEQLKYLGTIKMHQNYVQEEIKGRTEVKESFTKLNSRHLKVKTQLYYIYQTMVTANNYMFRPLTSHHQFVHLMKRVEGCTIYNVTSVWWRDLVRRIVYIINSLT
jgi:hypothetical protein